MGKRQVKQSSIANPHRVVIPDACLQSLRFPSTEISTSGTVVRIRGEIDVGSINQCERIQDGEPGQNFPIDGSKDALILGIVFNRYSNGLRVHRTRCIFQHITVVSLDTRQRDVCLSFLMMIFESFHT